MQQFKMPFAQHYNVIKWFEFGSSFSHLNMMIMLAQ